MYRKKQRLSGETMTTLLNGILGDLTGDSVAVGSSSGRNGVEAAEAPYIVPDVPVTRVQGVRALKSCTYLENATTPTQTLVAILATDCVQELSAWLMKTQKQKAWLSKKPEERPVVNLSTLRFSPAVRALHNVIYEMEDCADKGLANILSLLDGRLVHTSTFSCLG